MKDCRVKLIDQEICNKETYNMGLMKFKREQKKSVLLKMAKEDLHNFLLKFHQLAYNIKCLEKVSRKVNKFSKMNVLLEKLDKL